MGEIVKKNKGNETKNRQTFILHVGFIFMKQSCQ